MYEWVRDVCIELGASRQDLVPFEKYAAAARTLERPSSAASAVHAGATAIERVDRLIQSVAGQRGLHSDALNEIVSLVDRRLQMNRGRTESMLAQTT
jgi:hypothetical protein